MAFPSPHPRRRLSNRPHVDTFKQPYPTLVDARDGPTAAYSLRKSATFHSPTSPSSSADGDPILNIPSLPRRSPTSARDLEAILPAGESHIAQVIGAVDRSFSDLKLFSSDHHDALNTDPSPVPLFMINTPDPSTPKDSVPLHPQDRPARKHHASDSGIGSTASSASSALGGAKPGMTHPTPVPPRSTPLPC